MGLLGGSETCAKAAMDYANDMKLACLSNAFLFTIAMSLCDCTVTKTNGNSDSYMTDAQPGTGEEMEVREE